MDTTNPPDSWDQVEKSGGGNNGGAEDVANALSALNVGAAEFVPGRNVHAPAFVPSFGPPATGM